MFSVSLTFTIPTLLLTGYQFFKKAASIEYSEGIFVVLSFVLLLVSLVESFQWAFSYGNNVECIVVAVFREYALASVLAITTCICIHLCLLTRQPKWLLVIGEIKRRRYQKLLFFYIQVTFILPLLFIPWPFVTNGYGKSYYMCWIMQQQCKSGYSYSGVTEQLLLWHLLAALVWLCTMVIIIFVLYSMRCRSCRKLTTNSATLLGIMAAFLIIIVINVAVFVMDASTRAYHNHVWRKWLLYSSAICTPLLVIIVSLILMIRAYKKNQSQKTVPRMGYVIYDHGLNERLPLVA